MQGGITEQRDKLKEAVKEVDKQLARVAAYLEEPASSDILQVLETVGAVAVAFDQALARLRL